MSGADRIHPDLVLMYHSASTDVSSGTHRREEIFFLQLPVVTLVKLARGGSSLYRSLLASS